MRVCKDVGSVGSPPSNVRCPMNVRCTTDVGQPAPQAYPPLVHAAQSATAAALLLYVMRCQAVNIPIMPFGLPSD